MVSNQPAVIALLFTDASYMFFKFYDSRTTSLLVLKCSQSSSLAHELDSTHHILCVRGTEIAEDKHGEELSFVDLWQEHKFDECLLSSGITQVNAEN